MLFDTTEKNWSVLAQRLGGAAELARVRTREHILEHVLSLKEFPQPSDIFALWHGLFPEGAPILMRDRSVQEIYALELQFH
jgi:hypothetical protein